MYFSLMAVMADSDLASQSSRLTVDDMMANGTLAINRVEETQFQFTDFLDQLAHASASGNGTKNLLLKPVFTFREFITQQLKKSGQHDARRMSEGNFVDETFIRENEAALNRGLNNLGNEFLFIKYSEQETIPNITHADLTADEENQAQIA